MAGLSPLPRRCVAGPYRASSEQRPPPLKPGGVMPKPARPSPLAQQQRQPAPPAPATSEAAGVRVNKCFRAFASRRESDSFVADGRVTINGATAQPGQLVRPGDDVRLDGKPVSWSRLQVDLHQEDVFVSSASPLPLESSFRYLKLNKQAGVTCTMDDRVAGSLAQVLSPQLGGERVFSVGRLDKESTGLLLLTSDGRVPNAVLRSANGHEKLYRVRTDKRVSDADMAQLASGVVITTVAQSDGARKPLTAATKPCTVVRAAGRELLFTLREGRNRQIRKMTAALGYEVQELHRLTFAGITLGGLRPGEWMELEEREMVSLREAVRAASAGGTAVVEEDG